MTGFTNRSARDALEELVSEYPYVALFTTLGTDDGNGFVEVSGGSYTRAATGSGDWGPITAGANGPSVLVNQVPIVFPTPTADWGTVVSWGLLDDRSDEHIGASDYLGDFSWLPCTVSNGAPAVLTTGEPHNYVVGDTIVFTNEYGGISPTFSQANFIGPLVVAHASSIVFDVTSLGVQVNTNFTEIGFVRKLAPQIISAGQSPIQFPASSITIVIA